MGRIDRRGSCPYEALGVTSDVTDEQLKRQYHDLALQHHPDRNVGNEDEAEATFKRVTKAYQVLSDPHARELHDIEERVRNGLQQSAPLYDSPTVRYPRQQDTPFSNAPNTAGSVRSSSGLRDTHNTADAAVRNSSGLRSAAPRGPPPKTVPGDNPPLAPWSPAPSSPAPLYHRQFSEQENMPQRPQVPPGACVVLQAAGSSKAKAAVPWQMRTRVAHPVASDVLRITQQPRAIVPWKGGTIVRRYADGTGHTISKSDRNRTGDATQSALARGYDARSYDARSYDRSSRKPSKPGLFERGMQALLGRLMKGIDFTEM